MAATVRRSGACRGLRARRSRPRGPAGEVRAARLKRPCGAAAPSGEGDGLRPGPCRLSPLVGHTREVREPGGFPASARPRRIEVSWTPIGWGRNWPGHFPCCSSFVHLLCPGEELGSRAGYRSELFELSLEEKPRGATSSRVWKILHIFSKTVAWCRFGQTTAV